MRISRRKTTVILASALIAGGVAAPAVALGDNGNRHSNYSSNGSSRLDAIGLTENGTKLVSFRTNDPRNTRDVGTVRGLSGDTRLVGIDYRVQNGALYGVGNAGGIYTIDARNGAATKVGQLTVALSGTNFGVDFNPAANALRVVSDTGQNLRQPFMTPAANDADTPDVPDEATATDTTLSDPATPPATGRATPATGVSAAAYTNNDLDPATATVLYDLDVDQVQGVDRLDIQSPANDGLLAAVGNLRVDAGLDAGFDIYSTLRNNVSEDVEGFATLSVGSKNRLYSIDLDTGRATELGSFNRPVTDIAIPLAQR